MNGAKRVRTADLCNAIAALYQLSYGPFLLLYCPELAIEVKRF